MCWFYWLSFYLKLLEQSERVIGIDNLNTYYDLKLKKDRLNKLNELNSKQKICSNLKNAILKMKKLFQKYLILTNLITS